MFEESFWGYSDVGFYIFLNKDEKKGFVVLLNQSSSEEGLNFWNVPNDKNASFTSLFLFGSFSFYAHFVIVLCTGIPQRFVGANGPSCCHYSVTNWFAGCCQCRWRQPCEEEASQKR